MYLKNNWLKSGWLDSHSGLTGTIYDDGGNITGDSPGFVDGALQDYHLSIGSACINAGTSLHADAHPVIYQYLQHRSSETRPSDSTLDIGAFEVKQGTQPSRRSLAPIWFLLKN